jgi:hypothetical protein
MASGPLFFYFSQDSEMQLPVLAGKKLGLAQDACRE